MIEQEIKKAIENGESIWVPYNNQDFEFPDYNKVLELCKDNTVKIVFADGSSFPIGNFKISENGVSIRLPDNEFNTNCFMPTEVDVFTTKAEAEHYLHHANVERVEKLPFLTWEEFKEGKELRFYNGKYRYKMNWSVDPEIIVIKRYLDFDIDEFIFNERLTEANFYKAYDECVRLFKNGE